MGKSKYREYGDRPGHLFNEETSGCTPKIIITLGLTVLYLVGKVFFRD